MKTIWKFPIVITDEQTVQAPSGWQPLSVQVQGDQPAIWAMVDDEEPSVAQVVRVHRTGHPVDHSDLAFLGTIQLMSGALHVFVGVN